MAPFTPVLEQLFMAGVFALPVVLALALGVWTHRLGTATRPTKRRAAYLPLLPAALMGLGGVSMASNASSGLEGLGEALLGAYLGATGGLGVLTCIVALVLAARNVSRDRRPTVPRQPEVPGRPVQQSH